ncbi:hypothetical protein [Paenibacillus dokdonensis]|uniref:hypothetical protein n=1 Tax=Paenibacillus dokdonensis TaxID=2567944 RepID=UPI0010A7688E|nr:hypothetical protein [Paenibacillus dokdonensis]
MNALKLNSIKILLCLIILLVVISGCSKEETKEISAPSTLQLKSEYITIINDDIIADMIGEMYVSMIDSFNNRNKETGEMELNKPIPQYSDFITYDIKKAQKNNDTKKADLLLNLSTPYLTILESLKFSTPVLSKDDHGNYAIDSSTGISEENLQSIKQELTSKVEQYFQ